MSNVSVAFIRASVIYLLVGVSFGLIMAFPGGISWLMEIGNGQPNVAHAHTNLLGFLVMMVMGVAYHIFPRFTGNPVRPVWLPWANFWCSQVGTAGMVLGFLFRGVMPWLVPAAATVNAVAITCFAVAMLRVVKPVKRLMP